MGAVGGIRHIRNPISVARAVLDYTTHTMLVGDQGIPKIFVSGVDITNQAKVFLLPVTF